MNKVTKVYTCTLCEEYDDVCGHNLPQTGYRCNLCLFIHSRNREAESCCMDMTDKSVVDESCLAPVKQKRDKGLEYPTEAIAKRSGR